MLSADQRHLLGRQRVARLATADAFGAPHVVPVCFALAGDRIYVAIDEKTKRVGPFRLKRVRNVLANPVVALVADVYDADWSKVTGLMARGRAEVLEGGHEHRQAVELLRARYPQYASMALEQRPIIAIEIEAAVSW